MRHAIDHEPARPADTLAAVVFKRNRLLAALNQGFVEHVDALQHRHLDVGNVDRVADKLTRLLTILLAPDFQRYSHYL